MNRVSILNRLSTLSRKPLAVSACLFALTFCLTFALLFLINRVRADDAPDCSLPGNCTCLTQLFNPDGSPQKDEFNEDLCKGFYGFIDRRTNPPSCNVCSKSVTVECKKANFCAQCPVGCEGK